MGPSPGACWSRQLLVFHRCSSSCPPCPLPPPPGQATKMGKDARLLLALCKTADRQVAKLKKKEAAQATDADVKVGGGKEGGIAGRKE